MVPAHFMGEDGYGSFASLDADLLRLPNNSGNGGLSLVYSTVREPDDFTVASSCPRQPLPYCLFSGHFPLRTPAQHKRAPHKLY